MKFELYVQGHDIDDLVNHKNVKVADIVVVRPYPWNWGLMEIKHGLIFIVNVPNLFNPMPDLSSITKIQAARFLRKTGQWYRLKITPDETIDQVFSRLNELSVSELRALAIQVWKDFERDRLDIFFKSRLFDYGIHESEIINVDRETDPDYAEAKTIFDDPVVCTNPIETDAVYIGTRLWRNRPAILGRKKFRLPVARLRSLTSNGIDLNKIQDPDYIYQPFKSSVQLVQKFNGINGNNYLTTNDVDCEISGAIDPEEEISFDWVKITNPIPQDKFSDGDIDPTEETPPDLDND